MKTYCLKCKTNTDNIDPKMFRTKNNRLIMQPKGVVFVKIKIQDL